MYNESNPAHYFSVGRSATRNILLARASAQAGPVLSILDFACGSGRVTRWFRAAFPDASVFASDLRQDSLAFVSESLGAKPWLSAGNFDALVPPTQFDVIWCGSLITHLDAQSAASAISAMRSWLRPGGVLVFSFHGKKVLSNFRSGRSKYLSEELFAQVYEGYRRSGHGYVDYPGRKGLGFSLSRIDWVVNVAAPIEDAMHRVIHLAEAAWDNHHDVAAVQKLEEPRSL